MKLFVKFLSDAAVLMFVSASATAAIVSLFAYLLSGSIGFIDVWCYVMGVFIAVSVCTFMRKTVREKSCFTAKEIGSGGNYWADLIGENKFLKRSQAYLMLMPYFAAGLVLIATIVLCGGRLAEGGKTQSCVGYATLCSTLASLSTVLVIYPVMKMRALRVCKECGSVNSFIDDDSSEHVSTTAFYRYQASSVLSSNSMSVFKRKVDSNGDRRQCHCAKCGHGTLITEIFDADWHWL